MEASIEADRLEEQVFQSNYSIQEELETFNFLPEEYVLDAGCGTGVLSRYLVHKYGVKKVDAIDASDFRLQQALKLCDTYAKQCIKFTQQQLCNLDEHFYNKYDTVISRYVLEHVSEPIDALFELNKSLKKGGRIILFDLDGVFLNLYSDNKKLNHYMNEIKSNIKFDLEIGRKLPSYLHKAGFTKINWNVELLNCTEKRLKEEKENTEKRFIAVGDFFTELLGSRKKFEELKSLYLHEMTQPYNTLVFNKYICSGIKL